MMAIFGDRPFKDFAPGGTVVSLPPAGSFQEVAAPQSAAWAFATIERFQSLDRSPSEEKLYLAACACLTSYLGLSPLFTMQLGEHFQP